ncbi:uncharacterized protein LOC108100864 [Drosophila ficusphila]|uniref:uncharacterized protein LOC108100864 n=1 Tax=Drosophila ficusphila TaxID=30025 RepID=UPI0007E74FAB|nr:uncharacterized protein LOC108100864 [Drosophila ficusphila]
MEQFFAFPALAMGPGYVQFPHQIPMPCPAEYSLNPNAVEFVPSNRRSEFRSSQTKTEATSTTTLPCPEIVGDAVKQVKNGFCDQRQLLEYLSQLGDEQMPLEEIAVGLLPGGHGLSMTFTTKKADPNIPIFHNRQSLQLAVGDQEKLNSRPESVLVAQFLSRVNDLLSEKYEYGGDSSVCPKCTLCSNRSYTELEIERQIEGIKAFENFFTFTESTRYQDLVSHKAFKELCTKLGLIVSRDQIHIDRASSGTSTEPCPPPPSQQSSSVTVCIPRSDDAMETDMEAEAYAGDDESLSNGGETTPRASAESSNAADYVRGTLYRYEDSEGTQLVNQLNETESKADTNIVENFDLEVSRSTPAKSSIPTSIPSAFPRVYKSAKAKCSLRVAGPSGMQSVPPLHRSSLMGRPAGQSALTMPSNMHRLRDTAVEGQFPNGSTGSTAPRKLQGDSSLPAAARKQSRLPSTKSGCVYHQAGNVSAPSAGRVVKSGKAGSAVQKPQSNHICKGSKNNVASRIGMANSHATPQRMIPRSTHASMMRQTEVKRRMSLMRGDSDSDLLYNDYLFK